MKFSELVRVLEAVLRLAALERAPCWRNDMKRVFLAVAAFYHS